MIVITGRALKALLKGVDESQMVYVLTTDNFGYLIEGRVLHVDGGAFDIETIEGEAVFNVPTDNIQRLDVRSFRRYGSRSAQYSSDSARGGVS
jgi:hypothetical protein